MCRGKVQMVRVVVLEDLEDIAGEMGAAATLQVKALEAGRQAFMAVHVREVGVITEVMRRLAVLDNVIIRTNPSQGQFMETFFYYPCWEVRVVAVDVMLVALVVVARS